MLRLVGLLRGRPMSEIGQFFRGVAWLHATQNADGGWGGRSGTPSSIEETALALEALAAFPASPPLPSDGGPRLIADASECPRVARAVQYLATATRVGTHFPPSPIGFYFANLWYFEKLYPVIYTVAALTRLR